jgi:NAD(P)-dependent dehydrogenase (short-subunit alcohol dehydrogenase family)
MSELKSRVALVTGASRGIGAAIAVALAGAGAPVAVNYRERSQEAESVVDSIQRGGGRAIAIAADVSIAAMVQSMVHAAKRNALGSAPRSVWPERLETNARYIGGLGANHHIAAWPTPEVATLRTDVPSFTGVGIHEIRGLAPPVCILTHDFIFCHPSVLEGLPDTV